MAKVARVTCSVERHSRTHARCSGRMGGVGSLLSPSMVYSAKPERGGKRVRSCSECQGLQRCQKIIKINKTTVTHIFGGVLRRDISSRS